jgi:TrpR-related protein YerC/YecD
MKRKSIEPDAPPEVAETSLYEALLTLRNETEMQAFFHDLCTPAELEALRDRWRVVPLLAQDVPYREIHDRTAVSVTTVGRVARCLQMGEGGYRIAAERLGWLTPPVPTPLKRKSK